MYCPKCGTKNMQTAKFCKNCGQRLSSAQPVVAKQSMASKQKSDVRTQVLASTRTHAVVHEWLWFIGGLVLALIVGGIGLMVAL